MKIPFDIKFRPQIESGEYKVETRDGLPARIICWNKVDGCGQYIVALVQYTPDNENMISVCEDGIYKGTYGHGYDLLLITPEPELTEWEKAIKDLCWKVGIGEVVYKNNIIKKTAAELLELAKNEILRSDKWIIGNDALRLTYERGKAEALKDLPRWKKCGKDTGQTILYKGFCYGQNYLEMDGYRIMLSDLEKLPGFNE